jgi:hypothetical protein
VAVRCKSIVRCIVVASLWFGIPESSRAQDAQAPDALAGKGYFRGELVYSPATPIEGALSRELEQPTPDCGANSLYILLRLNGVNCERHTIHSEVPITGNGASMMDLQLAATRYGLHTKVAQILPRDLLKLGPSIALITNKESETVGHYVVVLKGDDTSLDYIDGTTGGLTTCRTGDFERAFSGYALITPRAAMKSAALVLLVILIAIELLGIAYLARLYYRAHR